MKLMPKTEIGLICTLVVTAYMLTLTLRKITGEIGKSMPSAVPAAPEGLRVDSEITFSSN